MSENPFTLFRTHSNEHSRCLEQGEGRALLSRAGDSSFRNFFWGRAFRRRQQQAPAVDRVSAFFS